MIEQDIMHPSRLCMHAHKTCAHAHRWTHKLACILGVHPSYTLVSGKNCDKGNASLFFAFIFAMATT